MTALARQSTAKAVWFDGLKCNPAIRLNAVLGDLDWMWAPSCDLRGTHHTRSDALKCNRVLGLDVTSLRGSSHRRTNAVRCP